MPLGFGLEGGQYNRSYVVCRAYCPLRPRTDQSRYPPRRSQPAQQQPQRGSRQARRPDADPTDTVVGRWSAISAPSARTGQVDGAASSSYRTGHTHSRTRTLAHPHTRIAVHACRQLTGRDVAAISLKSARACVRACVRACDGGGWWTRARPQGIYRTTTSPKIHAPSTTRTPIARPPRMEPGKCAHNAHKEKREDTQTFRSLSCMHARAARTQARPLGCAHPAHRPASKARKPRDARGGAPASSSRFADGAGSLGNL